MESVIAPPKVCAQGPKPRRDLDTGKAFEAIEDPQVITEAMKTLHTVVAVDRKVDALSDSLSRKLEKIAFVLGIRNLNVVDNGGDDSEDRKRLKEKLKAAFEVDRRRTHVVFSVKEKWLDYVFGICRPDQRIGKRGSRLIHPRSRFAQGLLFTSGTLLFYTAMVVPVQIFLWDYSDIEVACHFFMGTLDTSDTYCDNFRKIAFNYIFSPTGFWFDCATSLPWSLNDFYTYKSCGFASTKLSLNPEARVLRVVKILRILKITRILKAFKVVEALEDFGVVYLGSAVFKITRLTFVALFFVHLFACIFFQVKETSAASVNDVTSFYASKYVQEHDLAGQYLVCFYYVLTTFTTVGYGDIYAQSDGERVFCIFLFLTAASLFGTIIAQVNEIVSQLTNKKKDLDHILASYVYLNPRLDTSTMFKVREWERFQFAIDYEHRQHKKILERTIPDALKLTIARKIENKLFSKISFLVGLKAMGEIRTLFAAELLLRSKTRYYSRGSIIADSREDANGLVVITAGQVGAEIPIDSDDADEANKNDNGRTLLYVLERGDSIGDSAIAGDLRWAGSFGVNIDFVARSHCSVEFISIEDMQNILEKFEFFPIKCRIQRAFEAFKNIQEIRKKQVPQFFQQKVIFYWTLVIRHLSRFFDTNPHLRPPPSPVPEDLMATRCQSISLSKAQDEQIVEIFKLFDTDGGGTIDRREMELAMSVLGFQNQKWQRKDSQEETKLLNTLVGDGKVTLEEFRALMKGDFIGNNPYEEAQVAYTVLSRNNEETGRNGLITFKKLEAVCREYGVLLSSDDLKMMLENAAESCTSVHEVPPAVDLVTFISIIENSMW